MPALFLASTSPRRRELFRAAGFSPRLLTPVVEESAATFLSPRELVVLNAHRKLHAALRCAASQLTSNAVVVAADTLVCLDGIVFGKPRDLDDAARMLARMSDRTHHVLTGVALGQCSPARRPLHFVESTAVRFHRLTPAKIGRYLSRIDPLDKAGGYAAQENGREIIASIAGSWTNVVGLPMERLTAVLADLGIHPEKSGPPR